MIYTPMTKTAMCIAYEAHKNQVDKSGVPYIFHPIHLAEQMTDEVSCAVALLHDVVEDTSVTFEYLEVRFPHSVIEPLRLLTRDKSTPYMDYIKNLAPNDIARKVKIADIQHNNDETRIVGGILNLDQLERRRKKYKEALYYLTVDYGRGSLDDVY